MSVRRRSRRCVLIGLLALACCPGVSAAQTPVAAVSGTVTDASGAVVAGAIVVFKQEGTGASRVAMTRSEGQYRVENLAPGTYDVEASRAGFRTAIRRVTVRVGDNPTLDFELLVGGSAERVEVVAGAAGLNRTDFSVAGTVDRVQIENLPLNGRSFLELAQLQPAIAVISVTNPGGFGNNYHRVMVAGAYYSQTRIAVDGSTVGDRFAGGTMQGFSQESVQEFQVATFNLDLATGVGGSGAINIVTRRGSNDFRGSGFFSYRDHHLAAYPGLRRDRGASAPAFARRQSGGSGGGPILRDRLFWFANYERNDQDAVFAVTNNHPIFSKFDGIYPNPLTSDQFNLRVDGHARDRHQAFVRFSLDKNDTRAPAVAVGLPSNWQSVSNRAFQVQSGMVSVMTPQVVNDLRLSFNYLDGDLNPIPPGECGLPLACVGAGGPNILIFDAPQFRIGNQFNSPFARRQRTFQAVDTLTWQRGAHRLRVGAEWEHASLKASLAFNEPAQIVLWGPSNLQTPALSSLYDALPASLKDPAAPAPTLAEILQLPLRSFSTGIGNPSLPGPFNGDSASRNDRFRFYFQDAWLVRPNLTLSYGIAYSYETNLFAHDLDYPAYLAPLIGDDLRPPGRDTNNFDPALGLAWSPGQSGKTVIRGGGGVYRDEATLIWKARDRAFIGPSGNGRVAVDGSVTGFDFTSTPTTFTGQDLMPLLPALRSDLAGRFGNGTDLAIRGIDVIKQGDQIVDPDATTAYSIHANAGVQRELAPNLILTADYVMRRYVHVGPLQGVFIIDRNRFNRPRVTGVNPDTGVVSFVRDPVIPLCTAEQARALAPADVCSTGPINVFGSGANYRYHGLHVALDKRFSDGWQASVGYALARNTGFIDGGFTDFDDYSLAYGNMPDHRRHRLTLSGVWTPPEYRGGSTVLRAIRNSWTIAFISQMFSPPPLNTLLTGLDLDGDGISLTLLPGTTHNSLGQGLSPSELRDLVDLYNAGVEAGTRRIINQDGSVAIVRPRTPFNQIINPIVLPERFSNGDSFLTQDVRLTKRIRINRLAQLSLIGEVFNIFNVANLTGYSGVLNQPGYGQPSARVGQVFGTGGPRAFQFAARVLF
jgi:Carboxypeptidase regulatory-like domain